MVRVLAAPSSNQLDSSFILIGTYDSCHSLLPGGGTNSQPMGSNIEQNCSSLLRLSRAPVT